MPLHGQNIIGKSTCGKGSDTFRAVDPSTSQTLETDFHNATQAETDQVLALADQAFANRPKDPARTAELLNRCADEIEEVGDELIERCTAETALPAPRLQGERARTCNQLRLFAQLVEEGSWVDARIDTAIPDRTPLPKPDMRRMLTPIGPVLVFGASNFPLAFSVAGGDTASAFAAGCPVIVKARPAHPGTSELVGQAVQKAATAVGMPEGWFAMLHGPGRTTGTYLAKHPVVKAVGFTGSLSGGRALFDLATSRPDPIPVYAEMGSINPVFLMPEALAERAEQIADGFYQSVTLGAGQFCTNPGLVVAIDNEHLEKFVAVLCQHVKQMVPATMLLATILDSYEQGVQSLSKAGGVEVAAQARQAPDHDKTQCAAAVFVTDAEKLIDDRSLSHEVFGPSTLIVRCRNTDQMLEVARHLEGQLTATVHATQDELDRCGELLATLETKAGRLLFGGFPTGLEVCASTHHGGPYPATTDGRSTSVGTAAIERFTRAVCYQDFPQNLLPPQLRDDNPTGIWRLVDKQRTK